MEEQRHAAEQYEMAANQLKLEGASVQDFFQLAKEDLDNQFADMTLLGASVEKVQTELDLIVANIIAIDERQAAQEAEAKAQQMIQTDDV